MSTKRLQIIFFTVAILSTIMLYQLPTSVIDNSEVENSVNENLSIDRAIELVEGENPMEGIFMLRDIIEREPENVDALYYLGVLSLKTSQYEKASQRFNQIITIDSSDKRAYLQLGFSSYYLGKYKAADSLFNFIVESGDSLLIKELDVFLKSK
ncbi:MAG: tetratricopeptide repeat protein [Cytophagales bacterium]|tara:strand:- start:53 stop:514 length:462 start_codon:yes stop_codon:yes gene_type:complete